MGEISELKNRLQVALSRQDLNKKQKVKLIKTYIRFVRSAHNSMKKSKYASTDAKKRYKAEYSEFSAYASQSLSNL